MYYEDANGFRNLTYNENKFYKYDYYMSEN
jgi:hypothetical protein